MMNPSWILIWLVLCLYISGTSCLYYHPNLDGGNDGSNGNWFIVGTPHTPKLTVNLYCENSVAGSTMYLNFVVYQSDLGFKYSNIGPDDGEYVEYESCYFINVDDFLDSDALNRANYTSECGSDPSSVAFYSDGPTNDTTELDTIRTRSFTKTVEVERDSNISYCGSTHDDTTGESIFGIYCKRDIDYDKQFDYIFLVHYLIDGGDCEFFTDTYTYDVYPPTLVEVEQRYYVELNAYSTTDRFAWPPGPKSNDSDLIVATIDLGTLLYLEICIDLPDVDAGTGHRKFFRDNDTDAIGVYVEKCWAESVSNPGPGKEVKILDENCGTGVDPVEFWAIDEGDSSNIFRYVKDDVDSFYDWLRGPNCWRSRVFTSVSFKRPRIFEESILGFKCQVTYCESSNETKCFGDRDQDRKGYDGCAPTIKKRETINTGGNPIVVSTTIRIAPEERPEQIAVIDTCPESVELISSATVLSTILVIVLVIASLMSYRVQSLSNQINPKKRELSVVGKQNIGYQ